MKESHSHRATPSTGSKRLPLLTVALLTAATVTSMACSSPVASPPPTSAPEIYHVGAPDQLLISILPDPVIERVVVVRPDGRISVDLIGDVYAANLTPEEIASSIEKEISRFKRDAVVTVSVQAARSSTVTVFGQVTRPGTVVLDRETRLAEALGGLGGPTIFASKARVRVIRSDYQTETSQILLANLRHIQAGDQRTNFLLHDGDIIVVPPNAMARVGFTLATLFFPFQQVLSAGSGALLISRGF